MVWMVDLWSRERKYYSSFHIIRIPPIIQPPSSLSLLHMSASINAAWYYPHEIEYRHCTKMVQMNRPSSSSSSCEVKSQNKRLFFTWCISKVFFNWKIFSRKFFFCNQVEVLWPMQELLSQQMMELAFLSKNSTILRLFHNW